MPWTRKPSIFQILCSLGEIIQTRTIMADSQNVASLQMENKQLKEKMTELVRRFKALDAQHKALQQQSVDERIKKLEEEKLDVVNRTKDVIAKCRSLQKELDEAKKALSQSTSDQQSGDGSETKHEDLQQELAMVQQQQQTTQKAHDDLLTKLKLTVQKYRELQAFCEKLQSESKDSTAVMEELQGALRVKTDMLK